MTDLSPEELAAVETHRVRKAEARAWAEEKGQMYREYMTTSVVGLEVGVSIALASLIGWWVDRQLESAPWCMLFGLAVGMTHAGRILYKTAKKAMVDDDEGLNDHNAPEGSDPAGVPVSQKPSSPQEPPSQEPPSQESA